MSISQVGPRVRERGGGERGREREKGEGRERQMHCLIKSSMSFLSLSTMLTNDSHQCIHLYKCRCLG